MDRDRGGDAEMKERPILFSAPMVRAILDGRKTMTRRVIEPQPEYRENKSLHGEFGTFLKSWNIDNPAGKEGATQESPYGIPGDRLWVRETWAIKGCGSRVSLAPEAWPDGWPIDRLRYPATDEAPDPTKTYWWDKRPSIHMPRWASRILLEIVSVRVERLQEISGNDAIDEGCSGRNWWTGGNGQIILDEDDGNACSPSYEFKSLWDSINAARGFGWDVNPYVWCITFKRL